MAKGVTIVIQGDGESARAALAMVREQLKHTGDQAEHEGGRIAHAMERIKSALEYVAAYEVARELLDGLKELVGGSIELGTELGHLNQQTGISVENLSVLHYMAEKTGVGFETLTKGFKALSTNIRGVEDGSKTATAAFARLGISQADVKAQGGDLIKVMGVIGDKFQQLPDGARKAASAQDLFKKAGMAFIPVLNQGSQGMAELKGEAEALGLVLDEAGVQKLEAMHGALQRLKGAAEGAGLGFTEGLTPALTAMIGVIIEGNSKMGAFEAIGQGVGRVLAMAGAAGYGLASALNQVFVGVEMLVAVSPGLTSLGGIRSSALAQAHKDLDTIKQLNAKAKELRDLAVDGPKPTAEKPRPEPTGEFEPGGGKGKIAKPKSDNSIATAAAALADEEAKAQAEAIRNSTAAMIAELDTQHKLLLVADGAYYEEKLRLEVAAFDAEAAALTSKQATLTALLKRQGGDKLLRRDADGNSAEELRTRRELVQVEEQLGALRARSQEAEAANAAGVNASNLASELAGLKLAAGLERERNDGIAAQIRLIEREHELEAERNTNAGGSTYDAAAIRHLGEIEAAKLRIGEVNRQITVTEADYARAVAELNDQASKDPRLKGAAQKQIAELNREEAAGLRDLVAAYGQLAATLGGEYLETAKNLHSELSKLNRPDGREEAAFAKTLAAGIEGMTKSIADSALEGTQSFHRMVQSIEKDALNLALKLAEQQWITPLLEGQGKTRLPGPNPASSPLAAAAAALGSGAAPSLAGPAAPSGVGAIFGKLFGLGDAGLPGGKRGNGAAPKVTIQITNTGAPAGLTQTGASFDSDLNEFVVHAVLNNAVNGGVLASVFRGL